MAFELNKTHLAALFGVSVRTVSTWQQGEDFPQARADGRERWYPANAVLQWWHEREIQRVIDGDEPVTMDLTEARTHLAIAQTEKARVETRLKEADLARARGDLVSVSEIGAAWQRIVSDARSKMLSIPSKVASLVAPVSNPAKVCKILTAEIEEALAELSRFDAG